MLNTPGLGGPPYESLELAFLENQKIFGFKIYRKMTKIFLNFYLRHYSDPGPQAQTLQGIFRR